MVFKNVTDFSATQWFVCIYGKSIKDLSIESVSTELKTFWVWVFTPILHNNGIFISEYNIMTCFKNSILLIQ